MPGPPEPKTWDPVLQAYVGPWHDPPTEQLVIDGNGNFGGHKGYFQWARAFGGPHPGDQTSASVCAWNHARQYANGEAGDFTWYSADYSSPYTGEPACPALPGPLDQADHGPGSSADVFVGATYAAEEESLPFIPGFASWANDVKLFGVAWDHVTSSGGFADFFFYTPTVDETPLGAVSYVHDVPDGWTDDWTPNVERLQVQPRRVAELHPTVEVPVQFWVDNRIRGSIDAPVAGNTGWGQWDEYVFNGTNWDSVRHWTTGDPAAGLPARTEHVLDYDADTFPVGDVSNTILTRINTAYNPFFPTTEPLPMSVIWGYAITEEVFTNGWSGDVGHPVVRTRGVNGVNFRWTFDFQPYPYRFVYERVPPLRQWPRDDDPQATGVRQLPRRSSRQQTTRQGWGGTFL